MRCRCHRSSERREGRLRNARFSERVSHLQLVRHALRRRHADARQLERLRDCGHDRYGTIGGDCHHPVDVVAPADFRHSLDVREVHELAHVGRLEAESARVPVDRDHAVAELSHPHDGAALMSPAADEEDGLQRVPSALPQVAGEPSRR